MRITEQSIKIRAADIVAHYTPQAGEIPLIAGSHLPILHLARESTHAIWEEQFGLPVPEALTRSSYTHSIEDREAVDLFTDELEVKLKKDQKSEVVRYKEDYGRYGYHVYTGDTAVMNHQYDIARGAVSLRRINYLAHLPPQDIDTKLTMAKPLSSAGKQSSLTGSNDRDCVIDVFNMNLATLVDAKPHTIAVFDNAATVEATRAAKAGQARNHDMPWLLGSLCTAYAQEKLGYTVRARTFVGADLAEIEERHIQPIRNRLPHTQFMLNVLVSSEVSVVANHAVAVVSAGEGMIVLQDPKRGPVQMSSSEFWRRWIPTNMQAVLVIAVPSQI